MHKLFFVYFVNLCMFRTYLDPSSGGKTVTNQDDRQSSKKNNKYHCTHTVVPPDDGPRYARIMQRLTKYTKNKLKLYHPGVFTKLNKWFLSVKHTFILYLMHYLSNMFRLTIESLSGPYIKIQILIHSKCVT
jgi:hypothetical protein